MIYLTEVIMLFLLDLDETLLFSEGEESEGNWFKPRPGLEEFLLFVNKHFQLGIFTAADYEYTQEAIDRLFPFSIDKQFVFHRKYTDHQFDHDLYKKVRVKKIHKIATKLSFAHQDVVILDDLDSARITPLSQVIKAEPYKGDDDDVFLYVLKNKLERIIKNGHGNGLDLVKQLGYIAENKPTYHGLW